MDPYGTFFRPKGMEGMLFTMYALKVTPMQRCALLHLGQMLQYPSEMKGGRGDMIMCVKITPDRCWYMDQQLK
jgi:hypothetical protein